MWFWWCDSNGTAVTSLSSDRQSTTLVVGWSVRCVSEGRLRRAHTHTHDSEVSFKSTRHFTQYGVCWIEVSSALWYLLSPYNKRRGKLNGQISECYYLYMHLNIMFGSVGYFLYLKWLMLPLFFLAAAVISVASRSAASSYMLLLSNT